MTVRKCHHWSKKKPGCPILIGNSFVCKQFLSPNDNTYKYYTGKVVGRRRDGQHYLYMVQYEDNDSEEMYGYEVRKHMEIYKAWEDIV